MDSLDLDFQHIPVLKEEVIEYLRITPGGRYIDGTIGGGGHTEAILKSNVRVLGIDKDRDAILHLKKKFETEIKSGKLVLVHGDFSDMERIARIHGFEQVDGILLDLGVSSYQLDSSTRGFSFLRDEPLDMRMNTEGGLTAKEIINKWSEDELYEIFSKFGEEIKAREVASEIVKVRREQDIESTGVLAKLISGIVPNQGIHPATKIFQALRIAVNSEIDNLQRGIESGFKLLNEGARFAVISFHSLEDRAVKLRFLSEARMGHGRLISKKPILASDHEMAGNRRSRSAKLRVFEKI